MQIMPSGGGWTNAAASVQQGHHDLKNSSSVHRANAAGSAIKVDRPEKSGDRDANERYDGPQADNKQEPKPPNPDESQTENASDLLSLPATEESPSYRLDLLG
jgi:hypothetical protein